MVDTPSKIIAYGASAKYADLVCAIAPYPKYVNLMFSRGASMPDPDGIIERHRQESAAYPGGRNDG